MKKKILCFLIGHKGKLKETSYCGHGDFMREYHCKRCGKDYVKFFSLTW